MFPPQSGNYRSIRCQYRGIRLARQGKGPNHLPAPRIDIPDQIGKRTTLSHEIIDQTIGLPGSHIPLKQGLARQPLIAAGPGVPYRVRLHNGVADGDVKQVSDSSCERYRNFIDARGFQSMHGNQFYLPTSEHRTQPSIESCSKIGHKTVCRNNVAALRGFEPRVPLDVEFLRDQHHVWKIKQRDT